jgi:hypothetical protein
MGTTWKPVQQTEIKDLNIVREVIAQIRKPIPPEVYEKLAKQDALLREAMDTSWRPSWAKTDE